MPRFSRESRENLFTCHRDLQVLMEQVIQVYDIKVIEGYRFKERQNRLFRENKTQVRWPNSKHNQRPSRAVDVVPWPLDWNNLSRFHYMGGLVIGTARVLFLKGVIEHRVRWGGDWNENDNPLDEGFYDGPHFELV